MSGDEVVIRARVEGDFEALVAGLALVAAADGYPGHWPVDPVAWLRCEVPPASGSSGLAGPHGAWVAARDGEVLGQVVLRRANAQRPVLLWSEVTGREPGACAMVSRLFVVPHARGAGVGEALLAAACATSFAAGLLPVLDVVDTAEAAVRLYRRLGWHEFGRYEWTFNSSSDTELLYCFAAPDSQK